MIRARLFNRSHTLVPLALWLVLGNSGIRVLNAQTPSQEAARLNVAIDVAIKSRDLSPEHAAKARNALTKASKQQDIRAALMFVYAADAALTYEKPRQADLERGYDYHFLGILGLVRRNESGSEFDPLAVMAANWQTSSGAPHVKYSGFSDVTSQWEAHAEKQVKDDPESMQTINEYLELRHFNVAADSAFNHVVHRLGLLRDIMSRWGYKLISGYDAFHAASDTRDYLEVYYQYWYFKRRGSPSPSETFQSTDPLRMLSRRVIQGIHADRKTMLIPIDAIIDDAIKQAEVIDAMPAETPSETPSFIGLENASASETRKLSFLVAKEPTTAATYRHRLSVLHAFTTTLHKADIEALYGSYTPDSLIALVEETRRKEGDVTAHQMLDRLLQRAKTTFH